MKFIIILVPLLIGISACSDHDQSYYENDMEAAEEKIEECKSKLKTAISNGNKEREQELYND